MKKLKSAAVTVVGLAAAAVICRILSRISGNDAYACSIFILATAVIARFTDGYIWAIASSFIGMFLVNWAFTEPYFSVTSLAGGYFISMISLLSVALIVGFQTTHIKKQAALESAAAQHKLRADLLRAMSHDMRTPLTSISGAAGLWLELHDTLPTDKQEKLISNIKKESEALYRAFENILALTRVDNGLSQINKRPEALEEVVWEVNHLFRQKHPEISLISDIPEELVMVPMDLLLIKQVMNNILDNSAEHGERVTEIIVSVRTVENTAIFTFSDNGVGIPEEILPDLFEPFVKKGILPDSNKNIGIGLTLCESVIRLHGGTIKGYNSHNGAVIEFTLPLINGG